MPFLQRSELFSLGEHLLLRHPFHVQQGGVIGHPEVAVPACLRRVHHLFEARQAVRQRGVGVQIPVEVLQLDQSCRQGAFGSGFDLAVVFAQCRGDPGHVQGCVDLLLELAEATTLVLSSEVSPYSGA